MFFTQSARAKSGLWEKFEPRWIRKYIALKLALNREHHTTYNEIHENIKAKESDKP